MGFIILRERRTKKEEEKMKIGGGPPGPFVIREARDEKEGNHEMRKLLEL